MPQEFHHNEYIKDMETGRDHSEEISGDNALGVVANEGQPPLSRIRSAPVAAAHVLADCARRDAKSQLYFQFIGDPLFTPSQILPRHGPDQVLQLLRNSRAPNGPGFLAPEQAESLAMQRSACLAGLRPEHPATRTID